MVLVGTSPIAETSMSEPIGELAFFAGRTRAASVVATLNNNVMYLSRNAYDSMAKETPELSKDILAALSQRLARTISSSPVLRPKASKFCSVFAGNDQAMNLRFIEGLRGAFDKVTVWTFITRDDCPSDALNDLDMMTVWPEECEATQKNLVLLRTDAAQDSNWHRVAADNSDTVVVAIEKNKAPETSTALSTLETEFYGATLRQNVQLVFLRADSAHPTTDTARWLEKCDVALAPPYYVG